MRDYNQGKIYKIVCNVTGLTYYGSTCEPILSRRLAKHRSNYKDYLNKATHSHYMTSYKILENENFDIILMENYPCHSNDELTSRERYYIEKNECVNKIIPTRTNKEYKKYYYDNNKNYLMEKSKNYHESNRETILQKNKENYEKNKETIKQRNKDYRTKNKEKTVEWYKTSYNRNKEKINERNKKYAEKNEEKLKEYKKVYSKKNKNKMKEYYKNYVKNNKDKIIEKSKRYREKNKLIIQEKRKEKINCICGSCVTKGNIKKHLTTKKHTDFISNNNNNNNI